MCYDKAYATRKHFQYASRYAGTPNETAKLEEQLKLLDVQPKYYATGFDHPDLMTIANDQPGTIQLMSWGFVPFWVNVAASNKTLNARSEDIFQTSSYKKAIHTNRCLIITDNFFEHHHKSGKKIPHLIRMRDSEPFSVAGIWKEHTDKDGITRRTVSLLTTEANPLMKRIHNNPDATGPRMPVILPKEFERQWLSETEDEKHTMDLVADLCKPFDQDMMEAYTVRQLKGKNGVGNKPEAAQQFEYIELTGDLFGN